MKFNHEQARRFLELLDEEADTFTFQTVGNRKEPNKSEIIEGSLDDLGPRLAALNELDGRGLYVTVNQTDGKGRKASNITKIRAFFADIDGTLENPASFISHELPPTVTVKTGKGQHAYFVLREFLDATNENIKRFVDLQVRIANFYKSDASVKDVGRVMRLPGSLHSKEGSEFRQVEIMEVTNDYYTIEELEEIFPAGKPGRPKKVPGVSVVLGLKKGLLLPSAAEFLTLPWSATAGNNTRLVATIANMKKNNYSKQECIEALEGKGEKVDFKTIGQITAIYKDDLNYKIQPFYGRPEQWQLRELVFSSRIFREDDIPGFVWVVNEEAGICKKVCIDNVKIILGKEFQGRVEFCSRTYDPTTSKKILQDDEGLILVNTYKKPKLYDRLDPSVTKLPAPYKDFFNHLFPDKDSLEYVLNWIAFSIREGKNIPVLALVGTVRGLGKGALGSIITALHGEDNSTTSGQSLLSKEFNSQVYGKTFVFMDEVSIDNDAHLESIKAYTNMRINIEGKGVDAATKRFYGNIYLANNKLDSLKGVRVEDDRQFSIPIMNDKPLDYVGLAKKYGTRQDVRFLWEDMDLITELASYLCNKDLSNYDSMKNFKSAHYYEVVRNSDPEWFRFLLEDFKDKHHNCAVRFLDIKAAIKSVEGYTIGETKIKTITTAYPGLIALKRIGRVPYILFSKDNEDASEFQLRVMKCSLNDLQEFEIVKDNRIKSLL